MRNRKAIIYVLASTILYLLEYSILKTPTVDVVVSFVGVIGFDRGALGVVAGTLPEWLKQRVI